ncbi:DUF805 domain-containing protein [Rhizobium sp. AAP43]|uniref:DUF805 domain-containing protein n=1 Tax=Rhizobium sp. AAP43 TaxID=1523420 RepID=UPI0006B92376|nr:DUF805 domain-containing protein [Rhizobium sp. AAP43]KPF42592.1 hypothetical protein IP76_16760 [Rhizobium sp. AAP43]
MIEVLFMFRGRLNRLQYFLTGLVAHLVVGGVAVIGIMSMRSGSGVQILLLLALFGLVSLWMSLSLQAARIRDIGLSPLLVMLGFTAVFVVAYGAEAQMVGTPIGSLLSALTIGLQLVSGLFLLFMPGDSFSWTAPDAPRPDHPSLDRRTVAARNGSPTPTRSGVTRSSDPTSQRSSGTASQAAQARPAFGRRGM